MFHSSRSHLLIFISLMLLQTSCANRQLGDYVENYASFERTVYVVNHGIHTAIVVDAKPLVARLGLTNTLFNNYKYIEVGRGDAGYYQAKESVFMVTLKALFLSTPAVLHLNVFNSTPDKYFPESESIEIKLSKLSMERLYDNLARNFSLNKGVAIELAIGRNERSRFFKANGQYHMFYTCNNWTAEMMRKSDFPIRYQLSFFADSVMKQLNRVQDEVFPEQAVDDSLGNDNR